MIRKPIVFTNRQPLNRALAAEVVQTASRFEARVMISHEQKLVNAKSMLGLLSLGSDEQEGMMLLTEGPDEVQAAEAVAALLT